MQTVSIELYMHVFDVLNRTTGLFHTNYKDVVLNYCVFFWICGCTVVANMKPIFYDMEL